MSERTAGPGAGRLVVVGDVLLDREIYGTVDRLCPEAPVPVLAETSVQDRPGGAGLAALFAAAGGSTAATGEGGAEDANWSEVVVVGGFSADAGGRRLRELLGQAGIRVIAVPFSGPTAEKIRMRAGHHLLLRLDRGDGGGQLGPVPGDALAALRSADAILVSDYGRGVAAHPELVVALAGQAARVPVVWDPHPKGRAPVPGIRLATPNRSEAAGFVAALGSTYRRLPGYPGRRNGNRSGGAGMDPRLAAAGADATLLRRGWSADAVVVTVAEQGAVLATAGRRLDRVPAPFAARGDACGAGDRFASAAVAALAAGASTVEAVRVAVRAATSFVAAGGVLSWSADNPVPEPAGAVPPALTRSGT